MLSNRRQYGRYTTPCLDTLVIPLFANSFSAIQATMFNLSLGGVKLFSDVCLQTGEYQLEFTLPNNGISVVRAQLCYCDVANSVLGTYANGFQFIAMSPNDHQKITVYCQKSVLLKSIG